MNRRLLSAIFRRSTPPPRPEERDALESRLLQRFDAMAPERTARHVPWFRIAAPALVLVSVLTASRVPAEYVVEVGKRITLEIPAGQPLPPRNLGATLAETMRAEGSRVVDVAVMMRRQPDGSSRLVVDVWGDRFADQNKVRDRIASMPALQPYSPRIEELRGRVRDSLLDKVGHSLFRVGASPEERERARQQLIAHLRAEEGPDAKVDVELEGDGTDGPFKVRVKKEVRRPLHSGDSPSSPAGAPPPGLSPEETRRERPSPAESR